MGLVRSRWAAIGAAVAVTLGAGGLISVGASNDSSSLVPITPTRVLDTRSGDRVGSLDTAGASDPYRLKVTGAAGIPGSGVTAVSLNVTAVETQTNDYGGFLSVYPCASVSTVKPDVSNINFGSGQTVANAVTVPVSTDGHVCVYVYGTAHVLVDVNGFYMSATAGAVDAYTKAETDTKLGTKADQTTVDADAAALRALAAALQTPLTVDSDGDVGEDTSIAIGDNGNPVISYFDFTNTALKVAACANAGCTGTPTITTVDSDGAVGYYTSIAIGDNGNPVISYRDSTNTALKVAACTTADCSGTPTITTVDSDGDVGYYTSIAIGDNGYPVISYLDATNSALKVAACTNADCTGTPTITTIDSTDNVGYDTSIAIGDNGYPVISYRDATNTALKVAACTATDCSGTPTITTIDSDGAVGYYTSIAIGDNGYPVISYYDSTNTALKVAACANAGCTGTPTVTTVDSDGDVVGLFTSIAIGDNGYPVISYWDVTNIALKVAACTTTDCTGTPTLTIFDSINDVGRYSSIAIGSNGNPVISYYDLTNGALKFVRMWSFMIPN
ncbi:MAG: hypothetical protein ISP35_00565 [Ilumatobacteraceae bacterium]|nr:hypothetical protein [Ilumatobacteraceae bacterium]